jgi:hypothetical protein
MDNNTLQIKVKERLNKLSSQDYDNIECWQISEAFNKAQLEWVRRQIHAGATTPLNDESSKMQIDDVQPLLVSLAINVVPRFGFYETASIPGDYLYFKRISADSLSECCPPRKLIIYEAAEADVDNLLVDSLKKPSVEWGETFFTMQGNKIRIYTNNEFQINTPTLTYYRKPAFVTFANCVSLTDGTATVDVPCEFKDDIVELIIDNTVAILAGDLELFNQYQRNKGNAQENE